MKDNEIIQKANYDATRSAVLDFATHVNPSTRSTIRKGLQRQAFKMIDQNVDNPNSKAELKSLYRKTVSQRTLEKDEEEVCWRKYLAANENYKFPVDEQGREIVPVHQQCLTCEKGPYGGTYETGENNPAVGFCGKHESVKGKLEGKI